MFQDAAGTTPVTAAGDPVGLVLDKRLGRGIGTELVSNNTFATDTVWSKGTDWTIGSGVATKTAGTASVLSQTITLEAGVSYRLVYTITRTAGALTPRFTGGTTVSGTAQSASGTYVDILAAVSGNTTLEFSADAAFAGTVDNVYVKRVSGNDAFQVLDTSRPTYRVASGRPYLEFDGTNDSLLTSTINPGAVDKAQVFAGVRKVSAASGIIFETSTTTNTNSGAMILSVNDAEPLQRRWNFAGKGTSIVGVGDQTLAPDTAVITGLCDISAPLTRVRRNGVVGTAGGPENSTLGTGHFLSHPLFIGRRNNASLPFNGWLYGLIIRFSSANLNDATIAQAETWVNGKTGAY